jgi:hypothetical protein
MAVDEQIIRMPENDDVAEPQYSFQKRIDPAARELAETMLREGASLQQIIDATGISRTTLQSWRRRATAEQAVTISAPKRTERRESRSKGRSGEVGRAVPETGQSPEFLRARQELSEGWQGLWNSIAELWDDEEIAMSDREAELWGDRAARTLELAGHLEKTRYIAPAGLLGVTIAQAKPRLERLANRPLRRQKPEGPQPRFGIPPGLRQQPQNQPSPAPGEPAPEPTQPIPHQGAEAFGGANLPTVDLTDENAASDTGEW